MDSLSRQRSIYLFHNSISGLKMMPNIALMRTRTPLKIENTIKHQLYNLFLVENTIYTTKRQTHVCKVFHKIRTKCHISHSMYI